MRNWIFVIAGVVALSSPLPARSQCTGSNGRPAYPSASFAATNGYGPYSTYGPPSAPSTTFQPYASTYPIPYQPGYSWNHHPRVIVVVINPNGMGSLPPGMMSNGYSQSFGNGYQGGPSYDPRFRSPY